MKVKRVQGSFCIFLQKPGDLKNFFLKTILKLWQVWVFLTMENPLYRLKLSLSGQNWTKKITPKKSLMMAGAYGMAMRKGKTLNTPIVKKNLTTLLLALPTKYIVFIFIIEYNSLRDFGP
jgi:hypothetical protein